MEDPRPYVAILLFESTSPSPGYRPLYREDVALVYAEDHERAVERAREHGLAQECTVYNDLGEAIALRLLEVVDVNEPLDDDLGGGAADLYARHFYDLDAWRRVETSLDQ